MSEQVEYYRMMKELQQEERSKQGEANEKTIFSLANELNFATQKTQNSIRIITKSVFVDIFPKSNKYHNIKTNKRGRFESCEAFVRSLFG